jgi:hypothetical protein
MTFLLLNSILFGSRGGNRRLLYCGLQDQYYMETRTDDLFLFLFSFLFGSRGGNGRLLYSGVQDQYCIETRTDDFFYFSFQFSLEAGEGTGGCSTVGCKTSTTPTPCSTSAASSL